MSDAEKITRRSAIVGGSAALVGGKANAKASQSETLGSGVPQATDSSPGFAYAKANSDPSIAVGDDVEVTFVWKRCIHARHCVAWLPSVFRSGQDPWMDPDAVSVDELATIVRMCPSGALHYHRTDGQPQEAAPDANTVMVRENGPLAVRADLRIDGEAIGYRATLCRCGKSNSAPFCDNSHVDAKFEATGEPETIDDPENARLFAYLEAREGVLDIAVEQDGPLIVKGPLQIQSGTGRRIDVTEETRLCRCGRSANKPFCDGSHADAQ